MPPTTPIARSKTAALTRVLDCVPRGYTRYTRGQIKGDKIASLANKFHRLYQIGASPGQRLIRKRHGIANALLVIYWPAESEIAHWLLLVTTGSGFENEQLSLVTSKPRLHWLNYELTRYASRGRTSWTWRRGKDEMAEYYQVVESLAGSRNTSRMSAFLVSLARQPGFHGVREQTKTLFAEARRRGYAEELPVIFHVQKVSHGERHELTG